MDLELRGKVVFIPGGSKGIGLACASAFAQEGATVVIASRGPENLDTAVRALDAQGWKVHAECVDLREVESVKDAVERVEAALGPIDILVNCAGAAAHHAPNDADPQRWADGMRDKYFPAIHAMDVIVPRMAARGGGAVVNIAGMGGKAPTPTHMAGGAANAALLLASAAMAKAWGPHGVRVNAINPGPVDTERAASSLRVRAQVSGKTQQQERAEREAAIPLRRFGQPDEVASVVVFLASARASYLTGASIPMDGGVNAAP